MQNITLIILIALMWVLLMIGLNVRNNSEIYVNEDLKNNNPDKKVVPIGRTKDETISQQILQSVTESQINLKITGDNVDKLSEHQPLVSPENIPSTHQVNNVGLKTERTIESYRVSNQLGLSWDEFISIPTKPATKQSFQLPSNLKLIYCSQELVDKVTKPALSNDNFKWCKWTLSDTGGKVKVGKSYGTLNGPDRDKYEQLNCNSVAQGKNPSCDDAWGDNQILSWKKNVKGNFCGTPSSKSTSKVTCMDSSSLARFCVFDNVMFDFSKMKNVKRPGRTDSRAWDNGFMASHCENQDENINFYEFYKPSVDPKVTKCNYVFNDTVLVQSHDDIHNLGHSMSDLMNVWAMLWLAGAGSYSQEMTFINIDAIRMGHNYHDELTEFTQHYKKNFARIFKAVDFAKDKSTVCFKRLIFPSRPVILFTWDGWWQDMKCSFVGPSSLFQRWNIQVRNSYGLLDNQKLLTNKKIQILLIIRKSNSGNMRYSSRTFGNTPQIIDALNEYAKDEQIKDESIPIIIIAQDLSQLSFEQQVQLISNSSLVIGMHGAGIANTMHMPIGTKFCCGVIEIFPQGEFQSIRGYGNMARRMGHYYQNIFLGSENTRSSGSIVPIGSLKSAVKASITKMKSGESSCVLPSVMKDPYFDSVPNKAWD
eukprot:gene10548-14170_t